MIDTAAILSIRSEHGFLFGVPDGNRLVIDDFALEAEGDWATEGLGLLRHAAAAGALRHADAAGLLRVVCPAPEPERREAVESLGARVAESWWHRDLDSSGIAATATEPMDSTVRVDGAEGRLVEAPPVYAPGGPVVLVTTVRDQSALLEIERASVRRGASVAVVILASGDDRGSELLEGNGYRRTTDFYETLGGVAEDNDQIS
ncbi:MAG TPA: hypothetical protein VFG33_36640 [Kribbella sp.]|uniref:hypothetical protein n=1 Tax=Kribbella sp. TaxID=1871183 RepID=UPI002D79FA42|nr:hypothetical protein [Kribbella sp.]HET6298955.1 hypothetical protein [Kribbella sp.]